MNEEYIFLNGLALIVHLKPFYKEVTDEAWISRARAASGD